MVAMNDVMRFLAPFRVSAPSALLMVTQLLLRADTEVESTKRARLRLRKAGDALRTEWNARGAAATTPGRREPTWDLANAWGALHGRLASIVRLPENTCPEQGRAAAVIEALMPRGLGVFRGDPGAQWLHSERLLELATEPARRAEIDALAGAYVLPAIRRAHRTLGVALGLDGEVTPGREAADVRALLADVCEAVRAYALQVIAATDLEDPESVKRANHQLEAIESFRSRVESADDVTQDEPVDGTVKDPAPPVNRPLDDHSPANDSAPSRRVA